MEKLKEFYRTWFHVILACTILLLLGTAWTNRFIQDDAFISFRYAENLVNGAGLVWNAGERIEGYTNFLWTMAIASGRVLGIDPVSWSYALGLLCFTLSLWCFYRAASLLLESRTMGLLLVILLGTNYTFNAFATGGLETQLQSALFLGMISLAAAAWRRGQWTRGRLLGLSLLSAAMLMTRLDSALLAVPLVVWADASALGNQEPHRAKARSLTLLLLPGGILVAAWFVWKLSYYGDILPNTFYIKASSTGNLGQGMLYVYSFFISYLLFPFIFLGILRGDIFRTHAPTLLKLCLGILVLWLAYVIKVGGDFMEFRFMVPVIPLILLLSGWFILNGLRHSALRAAGLLLIAAGSLVHSRTFAYSPERGIEPVSQLSAHLFSPNENWIGIGKALGEIFHATPDVTIAVSPAGAIPYYAELQSVDMLGLNDAWIPRNGHIIGDIPGHTRLATLAYLLERNVNLLIGHPWVRPKGEPVSLDPQSLRRFLILQSESTLVPPDAKILLIPLDERYNLVALYLSPHPAVERAIRERGWETVSNDEE